MTAQSNAKHVAHCLELAILLEASAHKPGNVSAVVDFEKTRYEHFLASAVASAPSFERAAERGFAVSQGRLCLSKVSIGQIIMDCIAEIDAWQHGGNTLLGTVILLLPIAVAAGMTREGRFETASLRANLKSVVESTTPEDAVNVYKAIGIAKPGGLGKAPKLDVNDPNAINTILQEKTSLYQVFKIAEKYDSICSEWVNNYHITFDSAYPSLGAHLRGSEDPSRAIVSTFLEVLADYPDTFIARKTSIEKSRQVSLEAREILDAGGFVTSAGRRKLARFDKRLRESSNLLNPGTTADIISAALALVVLEGYRP